MTEKELTIAIRGCSGKPVTLMNELNKMTENYYYPQIEEFAISLNCEIKHINGREITWEPITVDERNIGWLITKFKSVKMDGPQIRTKYLDREDIESCNCVYVGQDGKFMEFRSPKNWEIYFNQETHTAIIYEAPELECMFRGKIKNIS